VSTHGAGTLRARRVVTGLAMAAATLTGPAAATAATPEPKVTGPIPVTATSHPFGAADHEMIPENLRRYGFVEEEYLVSGEANIYEWPAAGPATVRKSGVPYTTRILVRRPAKRSHSSGNAVVEMLNPTNQFDLNIGWSIMRKQLLRSGDTWVGITIRPIAVDALKTFDPQRYGSLSFASPYPPGDPNRCVTTGVEAGTERGLAWDINSQVGKWIQSDAKSNPLRHAIDRVYGFGYSQTGGYLNTYVNAIHPLDVQRNHRPIYDGYFIAVAGGAFVGLAPINSCRTTPPATDPRHVTANVGVPVIRAMSQSDYLTGITARRPDSDAPRDRYRHYEIAGAGHASPFELYYSAKPEDIVKAGRAVPPVACNEGPRSRFPTSVAFNAILRNLEQWVRNGIRPPHAEPIQVVNGQPVLDEHGNVVGGVRSPYVDVPTATWHGNATGASFCFIAGWEEPFSQEKLETLYPTHGTYVRKVARSAFELTRDRFITLPDALGIVREAAHSDIP
jgi:Alpha/beta hydrolase domain